MLITTLAAAMICAQAMPEGLKVSTWVREDIFAGFLGNDLERFEKGVAKTEALLAANAGDAEALAWRAGAVLYRAVRASEAGDRAAFDRAYGQAKADFARAHQIATGGPKQTVLAVHGGSFAILADRLPAELRREGWGFVRASYSGLRDSQKDYFDKLPPHMRGEVLAGLAQAEQRLDGASGAALTELINALPESVYANRAKRWQERPEAAARTSLTCQTCHDAGRMEAVLARQKKQ